MRSLIVGGSSSIGQAIVSAFKAAGHDVVASYNANAPQDEAGATWVQADLRSGNGFEALAEAASGASVVVLMPSLSLGRRIDNYPVELVDEVVDVNFKGQFRAIQAVAPVLAADSQIIIMGSLSAQRGSADPLYGATKGAMHALAKSLSKSMAPKTRVNVVAPGMVTETGMYDGTPPEVIESHLSITPTRHFVSAGELAQIVLDITKPHWRQLNGACIDINGGQYVR